MNEQRTAERKSPQNITLENRKNMTVTAVDDVISFDECSVVLGSALGVISIEGEGLHIRKMNVEGGEIAIEGRINSLTYIDKAVRRSGLMRKK